MRTSKQRVRIDYAPMVPSCSLSSTGALTQVFNADGRQFEPDRALSPLVITPIVMIVAQDGTIGTTDADGKVLPVNANASMGDMKWMVNGEDITTRPEWSGLFVIDNSACDSRGAIAVRRNIPQGERVELRFEAYIADGRNGARVKVASSPVVLTTTDSAEDQYMLSMDSGDAVGYDPSRDKLALYDYEVGNGLAEEDESLRAQAADEECYLRDVPVSLWRGMKRVDPAGVTLRVLRRQGGDYVELGAGEGEMLSAGGGAVRLDLRLIDSGEYRVDAYTDKVVDGKPVPTLRAQAQFSVSRPYKAYQVDMVNSTAINPADKERRVQAVATRRGLSLKHPARLIRLQWMSDTSVLTEVEHNAGERGFIDLDRAGFNAKASTGVLDIYLDFEAKGAHAIATDGTGKAYADGTGRVYIVN